MRVIAKYVSVNTDSTDGTADEIIYDDRIEIMGDKSIDVEGDTGVVGSGHSQGGSVDDRSVIVNRFELPIGPIDFNPPPLFTVGVSSVRN